jgi:hypothetical protein
LNNYQLYCQLVVLELVLERAQVRELEREQGLELEREQGLEQQEHPYLA